MLKTDPRNHNIMLKTNPRDHNVMLKTDAMVKYNVEMWTEPGHFSTLKNDPRDSFQH